MARNATAFQVTHDEAGKNIRQPGAYCFLRRNDTVGMSVGITIGCPCGCGGVSFLFFDGLGAGQAEWTVAGEWPNVTLSPSIGIIVDASGSRPDDGEFHWHGYLEDGTFVER